MRSVIANEAPDAHTLAYEDFVGAEGLRLRRMLVARFGVDVGDEVFADALAWGWEHWGELSAMGNPLGYLYRVAQSSARRHWRWQRQPGFPPERGYSVADPEPGLPEALVRLPPAHRVAVLLVHAHGWTYAEAAEALGIPLSTVRNHVHRGMRKLRRLLGAHDEH